MNTHLRATVLAHIKECICEAERDHSPEEVAAAGQLLATDPAEPQKQLELAEVSRG